VGLYRLCFHYTETVSVCKGFSSVGAADTSTQRDSGTRRDISRLFIFSTRTGLYHLHVTLNPLKLLLQLFVASPWLHNPLTYHNNAWPHGLADRPSNPVIGARKVLKCGSCTFGRMARYSSVMV
jgi:hypothetical protein